MREQLFRYSICQARWRASKAIRCACQLVHIQKRVEQGNGNERQMIEMLLCKELYHSLPSESFSEKSHDGASAAESPISSHQHARFASATIWLQFVWAERREEYYRKDS